MFNASMENNNNYIILNNNLEDKCRKSQFCSNPENEPLLNYNCSVLEKKNLNLTGLVYTNVSNREERAIKAIFGFLYELAQGCPAGSSMAQVAPSKILIDIFTVS